MTKTELVERIAKDLTTAEDADQGRRLLLTRETGGWRLGYCAPSYTGAWGPGQTPAEWVVLDWLTTDDDPVTWLNLALGAAEALAIRRLAIKAAGATPAEVLVVIAEQPRVVVV